MEINKLKDRKSRFQKSIYRLWYQSWYLENQTALTGIQEVYLQHLLLLVLHHYEFLLPARPKIVLKQQHPCEKNIMINIFLKKIFS